MKKIILLSVCLYAWTAFSESAFLLHEDTGFSIGAFVQGGDADSFGVRSELPIANTFIPYVYVGLGDFNQAGAGLVFKLPEDLLPLPLAVKGEYAFGFSADDDDLELGSFLSIRALTSGPVPNIEKLHWYAEAGFDTVEFDTDFGTVDNSSIALEGGALYFLTDLFHVYAGFEYTEDVYFNIGMKIDF